MAGRLVLCIIGMFLAFGSEGCSGGGLGKFFGGFVLGAPDEETADEIAEMIKEQLEEPVIKEQKKDCEKHSGAFRYVYPKKRWICFNVGEELEREIVVDQQCATVDLKEPGFKYARGWALEAKSWIEATTQANIAAHQEFAQRAKTHVLELAATYLAPQNQEEAVTRAAAILTMASTSQSSKIKEDFVKIKYWSGSSVYEKWNTCELRECGPDCRSEIVTSTQKALQELGAWPDSDKKNGLQKMFKAMIAGVGGQDNQPKADESGETEKAPVADTPIIEPTAPEQPSRPKPAKRPTEPTAKPPIKRDSDKR